MGEKVEQARRLAREKRGDNVALRALERAQEYAWKCGQRRVRPGGEGKRAERNGISRLGDEVYTPGPGWGDVGSGARPSWRDPHNLSEVLAAFVKDSGWEEKVSVGELRSRWADIVGQASAKHCEIESYRDGTLVLAASSSSWQAQMTALSAVLKEKINKELGSDVVSEIKIYTRWK